MGFQLDHDLTLGDAAKQQFVFRNARVDQECNTRDVQFSSGGRCSARSVAAGCCAVERCYTHKFNMLGCTWHSDRFQSTTWVAV